MILRAMAEHRAGRGVRPLAAWFPFCAAGLNWFDEARAGKRSTRPAIDSHAGVIMELEPEQKLNPEDLIGKIIQLSGGSVVIADAPEQNEDDAAKTLVETELQDPATDAESIQNDNEEGIEL